VSVLFAASDCFSPCLSLSLPRDWCWLSDCKISYERSLASQAYLPSADCRFEGAEKCFQGTSVLEHASRWCFGEVCAGCRLPISPTKSANQQVRCAARGHSRPPGVQDLLWVSPWRGGGDDNPALVLVRGEVAVCFRQRGSSGVGRGKLMLPGVIPSWTARFGSVGVYFVCCSWLHYERCVDGISWVGWQLVTGDWLARFDRCYC